MLSLLRKKARLALLVVSLAAVFTGVGAALTLGPVSVAHARNTCLVQQSGGTTWWVSCGSSAGNFLYRCDASGCWDCDTAICQEQANQFCQACDDPNVQPEQGPVN